MPPHSFMPYVGGFASSAVTAVARGSLTAPEAASIAVARGNQIELLQTSPDGLVSVLRFPLHATIANLAAIRLPVFSGFSCSRCHRFPLFFFDSQGERMDSLLVTTDTNHFALLQYNPETKEVLTRVTGDASVCRNE